MALRPSLSRSAAPLALSLGIAFAGCGRIGPGASIRPDPTTFTPSTGSGGPGYQGFQYNNGCVTGSHSGGTYSYGSSTSTVGTQQCQ